MAQGLDATMTRLVFVREGSASSYSAMRFDKALRWRAFAPRVYARLQTKRRVPMHLCRRERVVC
jgi:hypothetical protein